MMIRYMEETDDRMAIGRIYRESWKYAYQGIIPQNYLESISAGIYGQRVWKTVAGCRCRRIGSIGVQGYFFMGTGRKPQSQKIL